MSPSNLDSVFVTGRKFFWRPWESCFATPSRYFHRLDRKNFGHANNWWEFSSSAIIYRSDFELRAGRQILIYLITGIFCHQKWRKINAIVSSRLNLVLFDRSSTRGRPTKGEAVVNWIWHFWLSNCVSSWGVSDLVVTEFRHSWCTYLDSHFDNVSILKIERLESEELDIDIAYACPIISVAKF